jgi:antagonist of KipI
VVLMYDAQTTGGYPALGVMAGVDLPLLAQCPPGTGCVRFTAITRAQAVAARRAQIAFLQSEFWEEA